jgi:hypothetical protein
MSSSAWDSATELLLLALNSPASRALAGTFAGAQSFKTHQRLVQIPALDRSGGNEGDETVALVIDEDTRSEENRKDEEMAERGRKSLGLGDADTSTEGQDEERDVGVTAPRGQVHPSPAAAGREDLPSPEDGVSTVETIAATTQERPQASDVAVPRQPLRYRAGLIDHKYY